MSGNDGEEVTREELEQEISTVRDTVEGVPETVAQIKAFLTETNDYGYSLWGNPIAWVISTIAAFIVASIFGVGQYLVDFIVAVSWPFEMAIEFLVDTVVNLGLPAGEWVLASIREMNQFLRQLALEAGVAAPFVVLGAYLVIGVVAYLTIRNTLTIVTGRI